MRHLLVGYDGSKPATRALDWAMREARARGLGVTVIQSWTDTYAGAGWIDQLGDPHGGELRAKLELDAALDDAAGRDRSIRVDGRVVGQLPRPALLDAAADAEMVVVGDRGRGGFTRLLLGSVSESLAGRAPTTVVVVRGESDRTGDVVVGVDGSDSSRAALRWAADAARRHGRRLHVVLAWSYLQPEGEHGPEPFRPDYAEADAAHALDRIVEDELGADRTIDVCRSAICGLPAKTLLEVGDDASLIVVGAHGRSGRLHSALGSTTRQLLPHAPCPVAVVRERVATTGDDDDAPA